MFLSLYRFAEANAIQPIDQPQGFLAISNGDLKLGGALPCAFGNRTSPTQKAEEVLEDRLAVWRLEKFPALPFRPQV